MGENNNDKDIDIVFGTAYSTTNYSVTTGHFTTSSAYSYMLHVKSKTKTGCDIGIYSGGLADYRGVYYIAVGY